VILFRENTPRRVLGPKVDFIAGAGVKRSRTPSQRLAVIATFDRALAFFRFDTRQNASSSRAFTGHTVDRNRERHRLQTTTRPNSCAPKREHPELILALAYGGDVAAPCPNANRVSRQSFSGAATRLEA